MTQTEPVNARDRRRFFRVGDRVSLSYSPIDARELDELSAQLKRPVLTREAIMSRFSIANSEMEYLLRKVQGDQPDVALYLARLNDKVDQLARALCLDGNELASAEPQSVDLSASGIAFHADHSLEPGQVVRLEMLIFPSLVHILTVGRVTRCDYRATSDPASHYRLAVDFDQIRDSDREALIQHVLHREMDALREQRTTLRVAEEINFQDNEPRFPSS